MTISVQQGPDWPSPVRSVKFGHVAHDGKPQPPPEAALIRLARQASRIKAPAAARSAQISVARWSQIENGYERRHGEYKPISGSAPAIAHMAYAVGLSPERLASEGERPDAAEILAEILSQHHADSPQRLTALGERLAQRRRALDEQWKDPATFATETHVELLLVEAIETRPDPQLSDGHVHQLARAYRLAPAVLRDALDGGSLDFPEPITDGRDAQIRAALPRLDETQKAVLLGIIDSWLHPTVPAAAEQEHRRTA